MELFKIFGTLGLRGVDETNRALDETAENGEKTSSKLGSAFSKIGSVAVKVGKVIATAMVGAGTAIVAIGKQAISAYADYEQLVGGVETLFKNSADTVIKNAANAYKTAGLSANDYMETVTSFSASLLQSLGGDTVKAAKQADMAITDMADNANKMGTSMEMIQNAYNGFAKQNYTMLDNLKLGYGGTKEEMERLLKDAQKISGIKYDLSSYSDLVDAIHVVQTEMGITGTTAKEAATTIQGSISSMKAAWTNLLTGLTDETQDFDTLINNLFESIVTVGDNLIPRIGVVLNGITEMLTKLGPKLAAKVPEIISELLPKVVQGATSLVNAVVDILPQLLQALLDAIPDLISGVEQIFKALVDVLPRFAEALVSALPTLIPQLVTAIINMVVYLMKHITEIIQPIIDKLPDIIISIVDALMQNLPTLIEGLVQLIVAIVGQTDKIIQSLIDVLPYVIERIIVGLWEALPALLSGIIQMLAAIGKSILESLGNFFEIIWSVLKGVVLGIWDIFKPVATWIYDNVIAPIANFFSGLWDGIVSTFHKVIDPWIEIIKRAATVVYDNVIKPIADFFTDLWKKLTDGFSKAWEGIKSVFKPVADWFKNIFSKAWQAVKNVFSTGGKIFDGIKDGIVKAFKTVVNAIIKGINKVVSIPFNAINWVLQKIHDVSILGVKPFEWVHTFNVPQIPLLAKGGVVDKSTIANIGEDGAEAVVPLERNTEWLDKLAERLNDSMGSKSSEAIMTKLDELIEAIKSLKIYLYGDTLVGELAPAMDTALGNINRLRGRGL